MAATVMDNVGFDAGKYPIVLSDALLGRASSPDVYTSIRYNHRPTATAGSSTSNVHLQPTDKDGANYHLSVTEDGQQYAYTGTRNRSESEYVLLFDADKKHYVLHRLDTSFDMNLAATPWTDDAATLRSQYAQVASPASQLSPGMSAGVSSSSTSSRTSVNPRPRTKKPTKAPLRDPSPDKDDDESSDDGLQIEYPGGPPPARKPAVFATPVFHTPVSDAESADEEAEDGHEGANRDQESESQRVTSPNRVYVGAGEDSDVEIGADLEADLEAELARAIEDADNDAESDVSEEE